MNNKEWESLMKAAKISKEAADLYKSLTPGAIGAVSQTAAFISHMQSMNAVKANLCGINPNSATNKLKELSKVGNEAILGKESVMNSAIINALNSARKQAMSILMRFYSLVNLADNNNPISNNSDGISGLPFFCIIIVLILF